MWFTSRDAAPSIMQYIHYATSTDGKNWNRYGIVIGANATLEDRVYGATVIEDGGIFKMWYVGDDLNPPYGARIFYATSPCPDILCHIPRWTNLDQTRTGDERWL
jgi:hypothetical protein